MLVALCSLKSSPGVTTASVALAVRWPAGRSPVVVECDPAGGDLAARFGLPTAPGLVTMAAAARRGHDPGGLWQHIQHLPAGPPVVVGPVGAEQARATLSVLAPPRSSVLRAAADRPGVVVLADCGRVEPDSPVLPVIRAADVMILLAHAHDDELSHVAGKLGIAAGWCARPAFVLVGDGYSRGEVERELRISVLGRLPHDPKGAAVLYGRRRSGPGPKRSALGRAALGLAHSITTAVARGGTSRAESPAVSGSAVGVLGGTGSATAGIPIPGAPINGVRP